MRESVKYLVVGASYAGSLLAARLAENGSVLLVDRVVPGERMNCGGGVHAGTFKKLDVDIPFVKTDTIVMSLPGRETWFPCRYVVVDRALLNKTLCERAVDAGAEFALMSYVDRDESAKTAEFKVKGDGIRSIAYEKIIFADGFHPGVRRLPRISKTDSDEPYLFSAGAAKVRIVEGIPKRPGTLYFRITEDNPFGYTWSFPMPDGKLNIGAGGIASTGIPESWIDELMEVENIMGRVLIKGGGVFPSRPFKRVMAGDAYLFGDAAGMVYALNGEGLKHIRDSLDLWTAAIADGRNLNHAWRRSATYLKLAFASKALRGIKKLSKIFNRPLYPTVCRWAAFSRRVVKM
ncbi:MAG: NAD(P)/FAD-dependent oxidoreductase [Kiritimatiellaeota bacterium]|nr:NAD(P)/FAD-dependent oxidoreductase [Kiritimatiellota bacterium]